MSAQKIEAELTALTESFANLVRSARINEDTDDTKRAQVCWKEKETVCYSTIFQRKIILIGLHQ